MKKFESKTFTAATYVKIQMADGESPLILAILNFIIENELYSFGPSTTGCGMYYAIHHPEDAKKIKRFVNKWIKENP